MATLPELESQSPETLHEFLRWLAFGLGRYIGIATTPHHATGDIHARIRSLAQHVIDAPQRTSDSDLGVATPVVSDTDSSSSVVTVISDYMFARQVAAYSDAADFHPDHARDTQREALQRSAAKHAQS